MANVDPSEFDFGKLTERIVSTYEDDSGTNFIDVRNLPVRDKIIHILELCTELLFPGYTGKRKITRDTIGSVVHELLIIIRRELAEQIELALRHQCRIKDCSTCDCATLASQHASELLNRIPAIRMKLKGDVEAAFAGDPAAKSFEEIVISYPHIVAIAVHRLAHELFLMDVPLIPRIMAEYAHSRTGIDIHPGATIGHKFFIDHGTGVVIGETAVIGNHVKIYQGVTLGAISFPKDNRGQIIRDRKRHPTLEDDVTVYAEATILGDITIGKGAVIGGNVWIRESVPPGTVIMIAKPESLYQKVERKKKERFREKSANAELIEKIQQIKKWRNAVILAHNYQPGEIQDLADYTGDSLGLSVQAARTKADVIVFCGVKFMAETAAILSPGKTVLLPEKMAGCPMADMIDARQLADMKNKYPDVLVVCYVNSTADVKALSDYCCTSGNAVELIQSLPKDRRILFVPDKNLGGFVQERTGRDMILWPGYCTTHVHIRVEDVQNARQEHPGAVVLAHPECTPEVRLAADELLSTGQMLKFVQTSDAKEFLIATETGILHSLKKQNPDKQFYPVTDKAICPNMKKITLEKVLWSLEDMQVRITVPEPIRSNAKKALDRMIEVLPK